jgi:3-hydroxyisobutyrate dehydrogenase-like beta-hydroxyacid dehydrogenase
VSEKARVGWIGLGRIGAPMAARVLAAGWPLALWARRGAEIESVRSLLQQGARWAGSAPALARECDIVCTAVTGPEDVRALHALLMPAARPGTLFIDLTTAGPATAQAAAELAQRHGHETLDAPVTGGVAGASSGSLTAFAGGEPLTLERARPLLAAFCRRVVACGPAGSGHRVKLVNQTLVAGILMGLADGARLARGAGLSAEALQGALAGGTASSFLLEAYLPRMVQGGGAVTFTLGLMLKDLLLARDEAQALGLEVPLIAAAVAAVEHAIERHGADAGVQALAS